MSAQTLLTIVNCEAFQTHKEFCKGSLVVANGLWVGKSRTKKAKGHVAVNTVRIHTVR
jgi:hypothetical protein